MDSIEPYLWVLLLIAAAAAGWMDAIGGGGGLIQLPALLLAIPPAFTPSALGTNKLSSIIGTSAAAVTYAREVPPPMKSIRPMMIAAFIGSSAGSLVATSLNPTVFRPVIFVLLVVVWVITLINPTSRVKAVLDHETPEHSWFIPIVAGLSLGFYDGAIGPGTGAFLLIFLVQMLGLSFLRASSSAKFVNVATNGASVLIFAASGHIMWFLGITMGCANLIGGVIGSRMAIRFGSEFVRKMLLIVVALLIVRLGFTIVV
ncbi:MAG: hypothetical protein RIS75_729 [Actinomycetota bacterium]